MHFNKTIWRLLAIMLVVMLAVAACGGDDDGGDSGDDSSNDAANTAVTLQLNWIHDPAWAAFYVAAEQGIFDAHNLDVTFNTVFDDEGNFISTTETVAAGDAMFGVADSGVLMQAIADGSPLVAVATIYQRHPLAFTALEHEDIATPQDLVGQTVHVSANSAVMYRALLAAENVDPERVNYVERTDYSVDLLLSGEADVIDAWVVNEIASLAVEDQTFTMILPSDYGVEMYPNVVFTTQQVIEEQPELVENFVAATVEGLQQVHSDVDTAIAMTAQYMEIDEAESAVLDEALHRSLPLIQPAGSQPGMMAADVWQTAQDILLQQEVLAEPLDAGDVYTLDFVNAAYE